jgi:hypothetical protein
MADSCIAAGLEDGSIVSFATGDPTNDGWAMWGGGPGHNGVEAPPSHARAKPEISYSSASTMRIDRPHRPRRGSRPVRARGLKHGDDLGQQQHRHVAPRAGAGLKLFFLRVGHSEATSRPVRARGLKHALLHLRDRLLGSRPVRARGLKPGRAELRREELLSRPVRARGLKHSPRRPTGAGTGVAPPAGACRYIAVAPLADAWIEAP